MSSTVAILLDETVAESTSKLLIYVAILMFILLIGMVIVYQAKSFMFNKQTLP